MISYCAVKLRLTFYIFFIYITEVQLFYCSVVLFNFPFCCASSKWWTSIRLDHWYMSIHMYTYLHSTTRVVVAMVLSAVWQWYTPPSLNSIILMFRNLRGQRDVISDKHVHLLLRLQGRFQLLQGRSKITEIQSLSTFKQNDVSRFYLF